MLGLIALTGALPAFLAVLVARLVETLPDAVDGGFDSPAGRSIVITLVWLAIVLVAQEIPGAAWIAWEDLLHRYNAHIRTRVMAATLASPRLELFEDPQLAALTDRAVRFVGAHPGEVVPGYAEKWAVQAQGLAAAILVATVWPIAAVVLVPMWLLVGRRMQADYAGTQPLWEDPRRRMGYFKQLGVMPVWAKEVRIFGLVEWIGDRFGRQWVVYMDGLWRNRRANEKFLVPLFIAIVIANGVVLVLAARSALDGTLGAGALTILVQGLFGMPSLANQDTDHLIELGSTSNPEVLVLEDAVASLPARAGTTPVADRPTQEIRFDDVHFGYPARESAVFSGLNLRIEAGSSLGVVGLNGAGKTTLIKLLAGLELPQQGQVSVDGTDLADLDPGSWRRTVAAIFQDFVRYEMPARDNIGFGAIEQLGQADISTAAQNAGVAGLLSELPDGPDTPLSRRLTGGVDLSGGQWQRIALARAIVAVEAGARVLVLDEPTAHLDVRAEADIYDRFLELTRGLTTIVISHRFSTVRRADRIVVLDAGRVTEDGSHDELLAVNGQYARLFRKQAMRYSDGGDDG